MNNNTNKENKAIKKLKEKCLEKSTLIINVLSASTVLLIIILSLYRINMIEIPLFGDLAKLKLSELKALNTSILVSILAFVVLIKLRKMLAQKEVQNNISINMTNKDFDNDFITEDDLEKLNSAFSNLINMDEKVAYNFRNTNEEDTEEITKPTTKFKDVIGLKEAKEELQTLVDFLQNPKKYTEAGAKLPKAALLYGPPGTGKTTLAKALAGEANVGFIYKTGSSFTNKYVGVGPENVRKMFKEANKQAPCIIFIDEIESLGQSRNGKENSEDLKTLDEFLSRLDGFESNKGVIVIGATNKPEYLDEAFVRPGRFDSKISVPLPQTKEERLEIIKHFASNKKFYEDVNFESLAKEMIGCSPAAIETVLNKAAIKQVSRREKAISSNILEEAFTEYLIEGHVEKDKSKRRKDELKLVAYHEAGHAVVGKMLGQDVCKVTILGTTSGAGGFTQTVPDKMGLHSKEDLEHEIMGLYGGRAAEEIYFGSLDKVTTGCSSDIEKASSIIKSMIKRYGMSKKYALISLGNEVKEELILDEETEIATNLYNNTLKILQNNREKLDNLAKALLEKEVLTGDEIELVMNGRMITKDIKDSIEEKQKEDYKEKSKIVAAKKLIEA